MARRFALMGALVVVACIGSSSAALGDACASVPLRTLTFSCGGLCAADASCVMQDATAHSRCATAKGNADKICTTAPSGACRAVCFAPHPASATTFKFYVAFNDSASGVAIANSAVAKVTEIPGEVPFEANQYVGRIGKLTLPTTTTNVVIAGGRTEDGTRGFVVDVELDAAMFRQAPLVTSVSLLNMDLSNTKQDIAALLPPSTKALDLRNTKMQQLPTGINALTELETLILDMNDIISISSTVKLPHLQTLKLSGNALTTFDAALPSLQALDLSSNRLLVFPYGILTSINLRSLRIAQNPTMKAVVFSASQFTKIAALEAFTIDSVVLDTVNCLVTQVKKLPTLSASVCVLPDSEWAARKHQAGRALKAEAETQGKSNTKTIVIVVVVVVILIVGLAVGSYLLWKRRVRVKEEQAKATNDNRATATASGDFERFFDADDDVDEPRDSPMRARGRPRLMKSESEDSIISHPRYTIEKDPELLPHRFRDVDIRDDRVIGAGGFTVVWLVTYTPQNRLLAAKRLIKDQAFARQKTMDFVSEIKINMQLVHPSIVEFVGVAWTTETDLQVFYEYMANGDLRSHLECVDASRWPWGYEKLRIAINMIEALVYVHSFLPPLVHRDLKSRNVLLDDGMKAKLCDFGVSRFASENNTMTTAVGSGRWLSPEVIAGSKDHDEASDIYAFGVILTELDTHQLPFEDSLGPQGEPLPEAAVLQSVAAGKLQPTLSATCPEEIRRIALQCLAFNPADRPSAIGVVYALRRMRNDWFKNRNILGTE